MPANDRSTSIIVRNTQPDDYVSILELSQRVYPHTPPWTPDQIASHLKVFPEGQFVAEDRKTGRILGMASSLIILWDDYDFEDHWGDFTDRGYFTNHDPDGHTLYGAEVMVDPEAQGLGIGKKIYAARRDLCRRKKLLRIRAGARLRGYASHAGEMSPEAYVTRVIRGQIGDPTLTFQLKQGFQVIAVVGGYLTRDPESRGFAAIIEWLNDEVAHLYDYEQQAFVAGHYRGPSRRSAEQA